MYMYNTYEYAYLVQVHMYIVPTSMYEVPRTRTLYLYIVLHVPGRSMIVHTSTRYVLCTYVYIQCACAHDTSYCRNYTPENCGSLRVCNTLLRAPGWYTYIRGTQYLVLMEKFRHTHRQTTLVCTSTYVLVREHTHSAPTGSHSIIIVCSSRATGLSSTGRTTV